MYDMQFSQTYRVLISCIAVAQELHGCLTLILPTGVLSDPTHTNCLATFELLEIVISRSMNLLTRHPLLYVKDIIDVLVMYSF